MKQFFGIFLNILFPSRLFVFYCLPTTQWFSNFRAKCSLPSQIWLEMKSKFSRFHRQLRRAVHWMPNRGRHRRRPALPSPLQFSSRRRAYSSEKVQNRHHRRCLADGVRRRRWRHETRLHRARHARLLLHDEHFLLGSQQCAHLFTRGRLGDPPDLSRWHGIASGHLGGAGAAGDGHYADRTAGAAKVLRPTNVPWNGGVDGTLSAVGPRPGSRQFQFDTGRWRSVEVGKDMHENTIVTQFTPRSLNC